MRADSGSYLAEVFGFPVNNRSDEAENVRQRHWCPFTDSRCAKQSRLLDYPFGVCSVRYSIYGLLLKPADDRAQAAAN